MGTLPGYTAFGGRHVETAVLANVLRQRGVDALNGEPLDEALLLGVGGGLGGGYWMFEFNDQIALVIQVAHSWENPVLFLTQVCERLSIPYSVRETSGARAAEAHLDAALDAGQAVVAWTDLASLPYSAAGPEWEKHYIHLVGVCGREETSGDWLIDDRAEGPWSVGREDFARARARIGSYKHRLLLVDPPGATDLRAAIEIGIRDGVEAMLNPPIKNFGLPAFAKWADLVANRKDKKGWPRVFSSAPGLYQALCGTFHGVESNGGGAMRPLYAEFLERAARLLDRPGLQRVAAEYRALGARWSDFAQAALPNEAEPLRTAKGLIQERIRLFHGTGPRALPALGENAAALAANEARVRTQGLGLEPPRVDELLGELSGRLRDIQQAEVAAAHALREAVSA